VGIGSYAPYLIGALQDSGTDLRTAMVTCIVSAGVVVVVLLWLGPENQGADTGMKVSHEAHEAHEGI